jgi:pyruvate/2-oxoglutarate dehydrogenase complex dihydrolipoamide dehydrogenase (E3) component
MSRSHYDIAIIGAGAAGLIGADFALQLGARVALIERDRIGGDCTWTGCVPSKSLIKVASIAADARRAALFGLQVGKSAADLGRVREYLRGTIQHIYAPTAPDALRAKGLAVHLGPTRFADPHTVDVSGTPVRARKLLICTGAEPKRPSLPGLDQVPHLTYKEIFENDRLPASMVVIGGGPVGCEVAQCYQRLGARVTIIAPRLLPRDEPEASELLSQVFAAEGMQHIRARAGAVRRENDLAVVETEQGAASGELLFVAVGRAPALGGLELEKAGVRYGEAGIEVNAKLQTSARHIYAAGDCIGGAQFSHLAGWQAFQAIRNALLPGGSAGLPETVPEVTFTVPEVARVGCSERAARERFRDDVRVAVLDLAHVDRAVNEADGRGFIKLITHRNGRILGATLVAERAGDALGELSLAMASRVTIGQLATAIHPYPTYNSAIQHLASQMAVRETLSGLKGKALRALARWSLARG